MSAEQVLRAAVVKALFGLTYQQLPFVGIKYRCATPVADDKVKTGGHCGLHALPAKELSVSADQYLLHTAGKMVFNIGDKPRGLFGRHGGAPAQFAEKIFMGFLDKGQQRPQTRFAAMLGIVALSGTLRLPVDGLYRGVDVDPDPGLSQTAQLPDPFAQDAHHLDQGSGQIDP